MGFKFCDSITPRFAAADIGRKLDGANSVRNIDLLSGGIDGCYSETQKA